MLQSICALVTTLIHEFIHYLNRTLRKEENPFIKTKKQKYCQYEFSDIGDFIDYLLFDLIDIIYPSDAKILLDINQYNTTTKDFKKKVIKNHTHAKINKENKFILKKHFINGYMKPNRNDNYQ